MVRENFGSGGPTRTAVVDWARGVYDDLDFTSVRTWLAAEPGRKAGGYLPVYAPREVLHAAGFLPVGIHGGGDRLEIIPNNATLAISMQERIYGVRNGLVERVFAVAGRGGAPRGAGKPAPDSGFFKR